jgi:hypothetical protein
MAEKVSEYIMTVGSDPDEMARGAARKQRFDRNMAWLQAQGQAIYDQHRGQHIVIAGQEMFADESAQTAMALARAAHPEDDGLFILYVQKDKMPRIYHAS